MYCERVLSRHILDFRCKRDACTGGTRMYCESALSRHILDFRCSSMVEQRPVKALVAGSSPAAGANYFLVWYTHVYGYGNSIFHNCLYRRNDLV